MEDMRDSYKKPVIDHIDIMKLFFKNKFSSIHDIIFKVNEAAVNIKRDIKIDNYPEKYEQKILRTLNAIL
jgi:hypothetical protein